MLKLYLHPISTPSLSVEFTAHAVGVKFEKKVVNLQSGEQRTEDFLEVNRAGKVPALQDGNFKISESLTIQRYLARRQGSDLFPEDMKGQAQIEQWMDYVAHHVRSPFNRIQFNRLIAPMLGQPSDENSIKMGLHFLEESLPIIDLKLESTEFLCGDSLSLGDLTLLASLDPAEILKVSLEPYPFVTRWRQALRERDFYQNVHTHFGAELGL
ncbi:MAG: glutathione S-transferase family protein [Hellea sp.]|nr:glutathione S-transferase family protein [Hellea sp.]